MLAPGASAEASDEAGGDVADDVPVQVRQDEHVVLLRALDEPHAERVDEHLARRDLRVVGGDLAEDGEEEPVRELHDVGLRDARDLAAAVGSRVVEGEANDPARGLRADRLDRDAGARSDLLRLEAVQRRDDLLGRFAARLVLDARVQVLGVLAHDDDVDAVVARADARIRLAGADAGVELELVAERDVHGAEAGADRGRDRALERGPVPPDRLERVVGQRSPRFFHHVHAGLADVPLELDPRRLEDAPRRLRELGARPVSGDKRHAMGHERGGSYLRTRGIPLR